MRVAFGIRSLIFATLFAAALVLGVALGPAAAAEPAAADSTTALAAGAGPVAFIDVVGNEWFAEAVTALAAEGIITGRADGSFGPADPVTRAQLAAFLARTLKLEGGPASLPFTDVQPGTWHFEPIASLYGAGLISGVTSDRFAPDLPVSRQQAASLVMRSLGSVLESAPRPGIDLDLGEADVPAWLAGFRDRLMIAPAHALSVANACRLQIIQGADGGWFYPGLNLTRAQMAVILYRAFFLPLSATDAPPAEIPADSGYPTQAKGSQGQLVAFLESRLAALHYPCGDVDGVYDQRTKDAVMAFEKVERLQRDGVCGAEVWQSLFGAQIPSARLSRPGTRVEVDLTRQVLFIVRENVVTEIVHVSTGKNGTPTGHGRVWLKQEDWQECSVGWMYYPSYFFPHIAIHGSSSVPPYPASHGCVRTPTWIAAWVYDQIPIGTSVDVYY